MTASTGDKFAVISPPMAGAGLMIRTADSLKNLITELLLNSGEEIALWAEGEAKRCADIWRKPLPRTCNRHDDCDRAERVRLEAYPGTQVPASFHCHDDECEECFGN